MRNILRAFEHSNDPDPHLDKQEKRPKQTLTGSQAGILNEMLHSCRLPSTFETQPKPFKERMALPVFVCLMGLSSRHAHSDLDTISCDYEDMC